MLTSKSTAPLRAHAADHEPDYDHHRYPACDLIQAHVDDSHEAADCGWLRMLEQEPVCQCLPTCWCHPATCWCHLEGPDAWIDEDEQRGRHYRLPDLMAGTA